MIEKSKILMFYPYGATKHYGEAIKAELEKRGAIVYGYDERPSQTSFMKIIIRLFKKKIPQIFDKYVSTIIAKHANTRFDYILICRGEAFTPYTINHLREAFPDSKIILYLWDILKCADVRENIPYCDNVFSFDPEDARQNNISFRPLFYINDYLDVKQALKPQHDLLFIGTLHSNRHIVVNQISQFCINNGISLFSYLYVPSFIVYIKDLLLKFPYIGISKVNFTPIDIKQTIEVINNSKAIIDINYSGQKSLSSRACEAMASRRKYITTNAEVTKYDFYKPNNILVVDLNNLDIPKDFINSDFEDIDKTIMSRYSVSGLVDDLFNFDIK